MKRFYLKIVWQGEKESYFCQKWFYMKITILSLSSQIFIIDLPTYDDYLFFSNLLESNEKGVILTIQVATYEFKSRLNIFNELSKTNKESLALKSLFERIPENSKFMVIPGKIDDCILLSKLKQKVERLNGKIENVFEFDCSMEHMTSLYYNIYFDSNVKQRKYIGEKKRDKRECRFCGKQTPKVPFKKTAHAISELLGNKNIICLEECDCCNEKFSKEIEQDIARMLMPFLSIYSIKGKNGIRTTTGKNFKLSLDESTKSDTNIGTIRMHLNQDFPNNIEEFLRTPHNLDTSTLKYTPQKVYKCLCKYVISVIDRKYLPNFQRTIDWIISPTKYCELPMVAVGNLSMSVKSPHLLVSLRKISNKNYPYCVALLVIANIVIAFIVPFTSMDRYSFLTLKKHEIFQNMIQSCYKGVNWSFERLSSSKKICMPIDFSVSILPKTI